MTKSGILKELIKAIVDGNEEAAAKATQEALKAGIEPLAAIDGAVLKAMEQMKKAYESFEIFLPEVLLAVDAMKASMRILTPQLPSERRRPGKVTIATVTGDIHDIGKNIVASMLSVAGFDVCDLGTDVSTSQIISKAEEIEANVIALSSLMTQSMYYQKDVIDYLRDRGIREKYFVIVGGGAVTLEWSKKIHADGYGKNHYDAVRICKQLMNETRGDRGK